VNKAASKGGRIATPESGGQSTGTGTGTGNRERRCWTKQGRAGQDDKTPGLGGKKPHTAKNEEVVGKIVYPVHAHWVREAALRRGEEVEKSIITRRTLKPAASQKISFHVSMQKGR
jgi:hypothetical protein